ncbi:MAG TPA: hypothetical protein VFN71_14595 [Methylomirabilota bacterium]|nr:hypothetical protein [Methylomirabilota bacterium]
MKRVVLGLMLVLAVGGCGESREKVRQRLARAEADMEACKKLVGLPDTPTPDNTQVFDPAQQGKMLTPEMLSQMRLKVECLIPLTELVEARRAAGTTN